MWVDLGYVTRLASKSKQQSSMTPHSVSPLVSSLSSLSDGLLAVRTTLCTSQFSVNLTQARVV